MMKQVSENKENFVWDKIRSIDELCELRRTAMNSFLLDYEHEESKSRYLDESLPHISFANDVFDIALCSHLLFLYSEILSITFHIESIKEMLRVAREVRIFPVTDLNAKQSEYLNPVILEFSKAGYEVVLKKVEYEFQKGANQYLCIKKSKN